MGYGAWDEQPSQPWSCLQPYRQPLGSTLVTNSCEILFPSSDPAPHPSTGEEVAVAVMEVFAELSRELRQLKDLPLAIASLQGASPAFRHTEVGVVWQRRSNAVFKGSYVAAILNYIIL